MSSVTIIHPNNAGGGQYIHTQLLPAEIWTVNHNLGQLIVDVTLANTDHEKIHAGITYLTVNTVEIRFAVPMTGTAIIQL